MTPLFSLFVLYTSDVAVKGNSNTTVAVPAHGYYSGTLSSVVVSLVGRWVTGVGGPVITDTSILCVRHLDKRLQ